jgi:hypothetical protein
VSYRSEMQRVGVAFEELKSTVLWINDQTAGMQLPADRRSRMVFGCIDLTIEHQAGISVLAEQPLWGPVYELLRPMLDSFIRGLWLAGCASEADLDSFEDDKLTFTPFDKYINEVEAKMARGQRGLLRRIKDSSWKNLCDFTHTGFQHVARRNSPTTTGPNYEPAELVQVLNFASALGLGAACQQAEFAGKSERSNSSRDGTQGVERPNLGCR